MQMLYRSILLIALFWLTPTVAAWAQSTSDTASLTEGMLAFREERYADAAAFFERITADDPDNAEAHYLLARLYFETPLRDEKKAGRALNKALELEPENLQYMVAKLVQLRADSWSFITDRLREQQRRDLARKILDLDSLNAFAHEELGVSAIEDFWKYRNAIMFPTLKYGNFLQNQSRRLNVDVIGEYESLLPDDNINPGPLAGPRQSFLTDNMVDLNEVFIADKFDVETLQQQGIPVQDLSRRAERAYDRAIGHLDIALSQNPRQALIYNHLMRIYALKGEYEDALDMLRDMYTYFPEDHTFWQYLGFAHHRAGNVEAAAKSFEEAQKFMTPEEQEAFSDLELILPEKERRVYRADPETYAAKFWASQDPRFLTTSNERKLEHYARLVYADLLYSAPQLGLRGWETQRGQIHIRYGLPQADVTVMANSNSRRISRSAGEEELLSPDFDDANPSGNSNTTVSDFGSQASRTGREIGDWNVFEEGNSYNIWQYDGFRFVFEDPFRNNEYRLYTPSARDLSEGELPWENDYVIIAKETISRRPEEYTYEAPGRQIDLPYLVSSFKGEEGKTDVYVHYAVPITSYDADQDVIDVTANVGTFLVAEDRDILVEQRRTVYGLNTQQVVSFEETSLWVDTKKMEAPPGTHELSVEFETVSGETVAVQQRDITVPDYADGSFAISDMVLAYRIDEVFDATGDVEGADLIRDGLQITPAPWSVFSPETPIYLYFEMYNLGFNDAGQTNYAVEAILQPRDDSRGVRRLLKRAFGRKKGGTAVNLPPGIGTTPDESQYLILDVEDEKTGLYTLTLRVRDNVSGETRETTQELFLE
ncbi:MAG: tetratricopeptide repeat protein [Bacteroidota bacterium]